MDGLNRSVNEMEENNDDIKKEEYKGSVRRRFEEARKNAENNDDMKKEEYKMFKGSGKYAEVMRYLEQKKWESSDRGIFRFLEEPEPEPEPEHKEPKKRRKCWDYSLLDAPLWVYWLFLVLVIIAIVIDVIVIFSTGKSFIWFI